MSSAENKAVFLSYASQDAEAAKRICEALRAAGVEVWFDQSELVGGDAWDQKIRKHIKECTLLIPVISASTQARTEGYFRLEWRLADQRTHLMAKGRPFLLPVVIDDTRDADAHVPDSFTEVQWTRLKDGETPPAFCERVKKLLSGEEGARVSRTVPAEPTGREAPSPASKSKPIWLWALLALLVLIPAYCILGPRRIPKEVAKLPAQVQPMVAEQTGAAAAPSEAEQLVKQARDLIYDPDSARNEFGLAENLLKRATELAPTSGEAWGASALLNHYFFSRAYDRDRQRLARSLSEAEKALRLSPHNTDALLAMGLHRQVLGEAERAKDFLEQARASDPQNPKVILAQSLQLADWVERAHFLRDAAGGVARPAELYYYSANDYDFAGWWDAARAANSRAIAAQPFWRTFVQGAVIEYTSTADPAKMDAWLDRVPELKRDEPRVAFMRYLAAILRRDGAAAVRVLNALAADYLEDNFYSGPKSYLLAHAYELAGQPMLALEQWQLAERVVRERLAAKPDDRFMRPMLAVLLAAQHRTAEARQTAAACAADERVMDVRIARELLAEAYERLGEPDRAITLLSGERPSTQDWGDVSAATLAAEPRWDTLRDRPGYPQLLEQLRRAENGGAGSRAPAAAKPDDKSVAVLAFANLSDDKGNEYFSDGISEELLNVLAKIPGLKVTARTSAFYFKGKNLPVAEVARQLGVAYVVEGSVRRAGSKVRIAAQLIKAADGFEVWSDHFDRELTDVFAVQDEIAGVIARNFQLKLGDAPHAERVVNPEAHQLYLQGKYLLNQFSVESAARAAGLLQRSIELDPSFAPAWVALAFTGITRGGYGNTRQDVEEGFGSARRAAERALALDPDLAIAHVALSAVQNAHDFNWKGAAESLHRAQALEPANADVIDGLGYLAYTFGQLDRAVALGAQAVALDPVNPSVRVDYGFSLCAARRFPEAEAEFRRVITLNPAALWGHAGLSVNFTVQGRYDEAAAAAEAVNENNEWSRLFTLALAQWGQRKAAESEANLARLSKTYGDVAAYQIAEAYAFRRDNDHAFEWLERAYRQRDSGLSWLRPDPLLGDLRKDPRWDPLLRKLGLADEQLK